MEHLVIIAPKGGSFAKYLRRFSEMYKKHSESASYAYFTYIGELSPKDKVCEILSIFIKQTCIKGCILFFNMS